MLARHALPVQLYGLLLYGADKCWASSCKSGQLGGVRLSGAVSDLLHHHCAAPSASPRKDCCWASDAMMDGVRRVGDEGALQRPVPQAPKAG